MVLEITDWKNYTRDTKLSWLTGDANGYDVCQHIKGYLLKIEKPHVSLLEVIMSGEVAELLCLQKEVGTADISFSHVQAVPLVTTVQSLKDAELKWEESGGTLRGPALLDKLGQI